MDMQMLSQRHIPSLCSFARMFEVVWGCVSLLAARITSCNRVAVLEVLLQLKVLPELLVRE